MPQSQTPAPVSEAVVNLIVNGDNIQVNIQSGWTLQNVLQNVLGLFGTKDFCNEGACGACAVIIEGRPVLACMTLAIECDGKAIETIEGIAKAGHPLVETYVKYHCMQCGFCTPGFVVTAKALLDKNPDPSDEDIRQALAGNLCRCGTYPQHILAVKEAAQILRGGK